MEAVSSVRVPVVPPTGECKPFQEVLIELASRLKLPAFVNADGTRKFRDYPDFIVNFQPQPGIGFLVGTGFSLVGLAWARLVAPGTTLPLPVDWLERADPAR